jgi:hypothetical protein
LIVPTQRRSSLIRGVGASTGNDQVHADVHVNVHVNIKVNAKLRIQESLASSHLVDARTGDVS